jgi:AAA family ATP:ADP antiporter
MSLTSRLLSPIVELRDDERATALLMFAYSFLLMTSYNAIKPITRSAFIKDLGADNLPWMPLVTAAVIGVLMAGYTWLLSRMPRRWGLSIVQSAMAAVLIGFWFLFKTQAVWVAVAFYLWGLLLGILLISQFWTLANVTYDARQAKRIFGFIGGGAPLGGMAGGFLAYRAETLGTFNLVLYSGAILLGGAVVASLILAREKPAEVIGAEAAKEEKGVGVGEAVRLLASSKHLQIIALVISFAAIGAQIIEQQLNMAAEASKGRTDVDAITSFLGLIGVWMSGIALFIQIWLTSRIHRFLGIGFALLVLPVSLGSSAVIMLLNAALWAPALARIADQSLRYTVDKTTREILFLPLPSDLKYRAKPFVDVTIDRIGKGAAGLLLLVLVQPWGFNLDWQRVSYASLAMTGLWIAMAIRAKRGYVAAFRQSIERGVVQPQDVRLAVADLSTIETLLQEMAHPDERRVINAIDVLESLDKRNLVTPLLLHHGSAAVRARALRALGAASVEIARPWVPSIEALLSDPGAEVRAAAIEALAAIRGEDAAALARPLLADPNPRIVATAAIALAGTGRPADMDTAETALTKLAGDPRDIAAGARRDVAVALRRVSDARFHPLLIALLHDPDPSVADEAMESVRAAGAGSFLFVPTLISLLRHRRLKSRARQVLVGYGEAVLDTLAHFVADPDEDIWVRRHLPATIALIPGQKAVDILVSRLAEPDGFLRYKIVAALEKLRRERPGLTFPREPIEARALKEGRRYFTYLSLHHNLFHRAGLARDSLLALALREKIERSADRTYRLLGLVYPWKDIAAARWAIEHGDARARASASEYLDNILTGQVRRRLMPLIEELPLDEKVRRGNVMIKSRPRDVEETLLELINDEDQVVSASAIDLVRQLQLWSLADDVEHVLAHRDPRDWYVFEAASWALAEHRMPQARRRELWREPLPATELAERLRGLPLFASVWIDELFRIGNAGRQARHEPGSILLPEDAVPETVHFLLDGRATSSARGGGSREVLPPSAIGFEEALQGRPAAATVRVTEPSVSLAISADDLRTLLSDNTDLVRGLFTTLVDNAAAPVVLKGAAPADVARLAANGLSPVERALVLQRVPLFERVSADEILGLASVAHEMPLAAGTTLFGESEPPFLCVVLAGEVAVESASGPAAAEPGDGVGIFETLGGSSRGRAAHGVRTGRALRIDGDDLFDLLGQNPELLRQVSSALFRVQGAGYSAGH